MPLYRRINRGGLDNQALKAQSKDPRFVRPTRFPFFQPDIAQIGALDAIRKTTGPVASHVLERAARQGNATPTRTLPFRISMIPFCVVVQTATSNPQILIPKNLNRVAFAICPEASTALVGYTFGQPVLNPNGSPLGLVVQNDTPTIWTGSTVPIDDIFVWIATGGPAAILGYEGIIAPEAN